MMKLILAVSMMFSSLQTFANYGDMDDFSTNPPSEGQRSAKIEGYLERCIQALKGTKHEANAATACGSVFAARTMEDCLTMGRQFSIPASTAQWYCNAVVNGRLSENKESAPPAIPVQDSENEESPSVSL